MNKEERIRRYGEEAYKKLLAQGRAYREEHQEQVKETTKKWKEEHPEQVIANSQEANRKGGKRYDKKIEYQTTGIPGEKKRIRNRHQNQYKPYKAIIAPDSQLHHEWIPYTPEYTGVALVEAKQHQYGIINVIQIFDGKITLLTEEEVKNGKKNSKEAN